MYDSDESVPENRISKKKEVQADASKRRMGRPSNAYKIMQELKAQGVDVDVIFGIYLINPRSNYIPKRLREELSPEALVQSVEIIASEEADKPTVIKHGLKWPAKIDKEIDAKKEISIKEDLASIAVRIDPYKFGWPKRGSGRLLYAEKERRIAQFFTSPDGEALLKERGIEGEFVTFSVVPYDVNVKKERLSAPKGGPLGSPNKVMSAKRLEKIKEKEEIFMKLPPTLHVKQKDEIAIQVKPFEETEGAPEVPENFANCMKNLNGKRCSVGRAVADSLHAVTNTQWFRSQCVDTISLRITRNKIGMFMAEVVFRDYNQRMVKQQEILPIGESLTALTPDTKHHPMLEALSRQVTPDRILNLNFENLHINYETTLNIRLIGIQPSKTTELCRIERSLEMSARKIADQDEVLAEAHEESALDEPIFKALNAFEKSAKEKFGRKYAISRYDEILRGGMQ